MEAENAQGTSPQHPSAAEGPEHASPNNLSTAFHSLWDSYRHNLQRHQFTLHLVDNLLTRIIFWTPPLSSHDLSHQSTTTQWREVAYGLLSLHRMAMDMAITHEQVIDSYGMTLQPTGAPAVPAMALRIALTVLHNLMPTILELARSNSSHSQRQQASYRLWLERVKFITRLVLLISYWKQIRKDETQEDIVAGLMQDGGMYHVGLEERPVPTVANARALKFRREYVGRRTGRRVISGQASSNGNDEQQQRNHRILWLRLVCGEMLRLCRPLYWAQAECNETSSGGDPQQLWKAWILTLVMEVASLQCLSGAVSRDNPQSQQELSRRRMKLFLYLLRSPMWDRTTEPRVVRTAALLRRVPLLGKLVETYLWEYLLYWKHPFVSEEE